MLKEARNVQPEVAEESHDPVDVAHATLVVAILTQAVEEEGMGYLDSQDGRYWLGLIGLDPEVIKTRLLHRMHNTELQEVA